MVEVDRVLANLAERQHGVVARWQLALLGIGRGPIEGRLARGGLHRLHQGTYAVGHRALTAESRWAAAVLACGPGAMLSIGQPLSNEAEVLGLTDRLSLHDLLERYPRRRGSALLRGLLKDDETLRGVTDQKLEERFATFLDAQRLPRPRLNADLAVRGRFFRVDCLWVEQRLIVELDGRASHGTRRAFEKDRERDRVLLTGGWRVLRVTWRQLHDDPAALTADLKRLLAIPPTLDS